MNSKPFPLLKITFVVVNFHLPLIPKPYIITSTSTSLSVGGSGKVNDDNIITTDFTDSYMCMYTWLLCKFIQLIHLAVYLSIYLYCNTPSRGLRAGARLCVVSRRNVIK